MKQNKIISFLAGFFISAIAFAVILILFLLATFDLAGGETLSQVENQRTALLIVSIIVALALFLLVRHSLKTGKKSRAYGMTVVIIAALMFIGIYYIINLAHTKLDTVVWKQSDPKPLDMAKTLVKEKKLTGLSHRQVTDMLGSDYTEHGDPVTDRGAIQYRVKENWTLTIYFQKNSVTNAELRLPLLGV